MPQVTKGPLLEYGQVDLQLAFPLGFNNKRPHLKKKKKLFSHFQELRPYPPFQRDMSSSQN